MRIQLLCGLLLVLLGTVSAHLDEHDLLEELHITPFAALDSLHGANASDHDFHKHCKVTCDGPGGLEQVALGNEGKHCFGTWRVFCKFEVHNHTAMAGTKCEGSFGGFESRDEGKIFLKCDGKMVHWGVMTLPHPPHPPHHHGDDDGPHPHFGPRPPKGPIRLISVHGCVGTQTLMMAHPKHADGALPMLSTEADEILESTWQRVEDSGIINGNYTPVAEGRCDGVSFAVKKARPARRRAGDGDEDEELSNDVQVLGMQAEALVDEEVDTIQHPSLLQRLSDMLPQFLPGDLFAPPPPCGDDEDASPQPPNPEDDPEGPPHGPPHKGPPHGPPHKGPKPPPHKGPKGPPPKFPGHCKMRCNGRRTFLHGALPCVGKFEAHCDFDIPHPPHGHGKHHNKTHDEDDTHVNGPGKPRALLHMHDHDHHHDLTKPPNCPCKKHHKKVHVDGTCEGVFSGRFMGTKCRGFSYAAMSSPRGQLVATCSRAHFVRAGPMPGGMGMRSVCTDKSMMVVLRADDADKDAQDADVQVE